MALELDVSEDEAGKAFFQKTWTRDDGLKPYLYKEKDFGAKRYRWLRGPEKEGDRFLKETKEALEYLEHYRKFGDQGKRLMSETLTIKEVSEGRTDTGRSGEGDCREAHFSRKDLLCHPG